jgi:hypothetical protein
MKYILQIGICNNKIKYVYTMISTDYYLIVLSVIVYVLRQNCRAAGWRWDTKKKYCQRITTCDNVFNCRYLWIGRSY